MSEAKVFRAYWFELRATGNPAIDRILETVANAGRAHHSTEHWAESPFAEPGDVSWVDRIQAAADQAAAAEKGSED